MIVATEGIDVLYIMTITTNAGDMTTTMIMAQTVAGRISDQLLHEIENGRYPQDIDVELCRITLRISVVLEAFIPVVEFDRKILMNSSV